MKAQNVCVTAAIWLVAAGSVWAQAAGGDVKPSSGQPTTAPAERLGARRWTEWSRG